MLEPLDALQERAKDIKITIDHSTCNNAGGGVCKSDACDIWACDIWSCNIWDATFGHRTLILGTGHFDLKTFGHKLVLCSKKCYAFSPNISEPAIVYVPNLLGYKEHGH